VVEMNDFGLSLGRHDHQRRHNTGQPDDRSTVRAVSDTFPLVALSRYDPQVTERLLPIPSACSRTTHGLPRTSSDQEG
jgi:hypothetical protein